MIEEQDNLLVARCQSGDRQAFEALVRKYQSVVFNCAFRVLGNAQDAEDAAQVTFLKVYDKLESFDPQKSFFSWMYRVCLNEAIDQRRKDRNVPLDEDVEGGPEDPESLLVQSDLKAMVQYALTQLPEDAREVITLRHFAELSYEEIGGILQLPEKTVKSRLYSARQRMKSLIQENRHRAYASHRPDSPV